MMDYQKEEQVYLVVPILTLCHTSISIDIANKQNLMVAHTLVSCELDVDIFHERLLNIPRFSTISRMPARMVMSPTTLPINLYFIVVRE